MSLTWLPPDVFGAEMAKRVKANKPFSMMRFGDGEYVVCKARTGDASIDEMRDRFRRWFPIDHLTNEDMLSISRRIITAFQECDLLGIPCWKEAYSYPKWMGLERFLEKCNMSKKRTFYFYDIFTVWRKTQFFWKILGKRDHLYVIASRDVSAGLRGRFGINNVHQILLQPERFLFKGKDAGLQKFVDAWKGPRQYPEMYDRVMGWIAEQEPLEGKLFLVGAGGLGKIYCGEIRRRGGMVLDLGAMFDGWAGLITRPYLRDIKAFHLEGGR